VEVELITSTTVHAFEGAMAILDPVEALQGDFRAPSHDGVQALPLTGEGRAVFDGIPAGLYQLHLVDALGMPFLDGPDPVFVSAVNGASALYRVESQRLHLVEGKVVESSVGDPLSGAVVRVDPRAELAVAPRMQVLTDEDGVFSVYTARAEVAAIDSTDYRAVNVRFGVAQTAGTLRMRPMQKRRSVVVPGRTSGVGPLTLHSLSTPDDRALIGEELPNGAVQFLDVGYQRALLECPLEAASEGSQGARWLREFITKRAGGKQEISLPDAELREGALRADPAFAARWGIECRMQVDRRTVLALDARAIDPSGGITLRLPSLPSKAPTPGWTLRCGLLDAGSEARTFSLAWRGEGADPAASGTTGLLRGVPAGDVTGPMTIVFDGDWITSGHVGSAVAGTVEVPAIGGGELYGSSPLVRGDIVRQGVTASSVNAVGASLRLPALDGLASMDLQLLHDGAEVRGLALRVVQKDAVISDEVLDLLGETPLVTDATGTVYLRNFVPGTYELRMDAGRSAMAAASVVQLTVGQNETMIVTIP
jgi:hypothetical protein